METSSVKIRRDFGVWLKRQAAARGAFVYELLEEFAARQLGGKKPWRLAASSAATDGTKRASPKGKRHNNVIR